METKKVKFLAVAVALLMSISFTSCLSSDNNTIQPVQRVITLKSIFPYQFQIEGTDFVFEANSSTIPDLSSNASPGDIVYINAQYDTSTQTIDQNTKKIVVTVFNAMKLNEKAYSVMEDVPYNRSVIATSNTQSYNPVFYSKNWLLVPIAFYVEKQNLETALKHTFYLVYDADNEMNDASTMVLRLRHNSSEDVNVEKSEVTMSKAFSIANFVDRFSQDNGTGKLKTIKLIVQEQMGTSPEIVAGSTEGYREYTYTIDYSAIAN